MLRKFALLHVTIAALSLSAASASPSDPLASATAYSLHVHNDGWDRDDYFPVGALFKQDDASFVAYGFDFTEQTLGPIGPGGGNLVQDWFTVRNAKAAPTPATPGNVGKFEAIWSWHFMPDTVDMGANGKFDKATRSYFDPSVRKYLIESGAQVARTYGVAVRPAMLWSLDNEWEGALDYTPRAVSGFHDWLRSTYGSLDSLNQAWGTSYTSWSDPVAPVSQPIIGNPAVWLDWHAYQDRYFTQLTADRMHAIVDADPEHRGVAQKITQQSFDLQTVGKARVMDPALFADLTRPFDPWFGLDVYDAGDIYLYQVNFAAQCARPATSADNPQHLFLTETNNHGGPGWEFAESMWRTLCNGVKAFDFYDFGQIGAPEDPAECGLSGPNGLLRSKAIYAARLAYDIRRNEGFWERCQEADVPKVALLLNRPDVLAADDIPGQMWSGPKNSRSKIYSALRSEGYWVDVIPYTKLNAAYLKQYKALFIVGGDHLSPDADAQIPQYAADGGLVIADMLAGYYDEHHRIVNGLSPLLGAKVNSFSASAAVNVNNLTGSDIANVTATSAHIDATSGGAPIMLTNTHGRGAAIYVATRLGELSGANFDDWLVSLLTAHGVKPGYTVVANDQTKSALRVEEPAAVDGNAALIIANTVEAPLGSSTIDVTLPSATTGQPYWSSAENQDLVPLTTKQLSNGQLRISLPGVATSGMILRMPHGAPMIAIAPISTAKTGIDGDLPVLNPGQRTTITVSIVNPTNSAVKPGLLKVRAPLGWTVSPGTIATPHLAANARATYHVVVTPPTDEILPYDERFYPINCRWSDGAADRAVTTTAVGVDVASTDCPQLLTDNAQYPAGFPRQIHTGATYTILNGPPGDDFPVSDPGSGASTGRGLQDGYSRWLMDSESVVIGALKPGQAAPIVFDLKGSYHIRDIRLLSADFPGYPQAMNVSVSQDGASYTPVGSATPDGAPGSGKWLDVHATHEAAGRYVKIDVALPPSGGRIAEVEIWGNR